MSSITDSIGWFLYVVVILFILSGLIAIRASMKSNKSISLMSLSQWTFAVIIAITFIVSDIHMYNLLWIVPVCFIVAFLPVGLVVGRFTGGVMIKIFKPGTTSSTDIVPSRHLELIKELLWMRIKDDPLTNENGNRTKKDIDDMPEMVLMGLPEATLVSIVHQYWLLKIDKDRSDQNILKTIERDKGQLTIASNAMPSYESLASYIKYRLYLDHSDGAPISENFIHAAIQKANAAYCPKK